MKKTLQEEYIAKEEKVVVIPHGVKESSKKPEASQGKGICILSLGFLRKGKGIECLIEGFEKLLEKYPSAKLVIVGGSHAHDRRGYSEVFKHFIPSNVQKRVVFTGFVDEEHLERLIWESDIIVLQSTEPYYVEASGALAAVADYGKPVVCSKVPKFQTELNSGEHYIAVAPSDSKELAKALALLMENKEVGNRLGKNLREALKGRRWSTVAEEHINLYERLLKT
jgi:glycosyltransferase involved in cell wall biosynthesis